VAPEPEPTARDAVVAWLSGLVAGAIFAALVAWQWSPFAEPPECVPGFPCTNYTRSPGPIMLAVVAMVSGLYAIAVQALVRRRLALRREARSPRPPLWASLTAATLIGLMIAALLLDLVLVAVISQG